MSTHDDRATSERRFRWLEAVSLTLCAGMLWVTHGDARAESQASGSAVKQDSVVRQSTSAPGDSVVYHLTSDSRFDVKTGRAGLFGFAGHDHVVRARAFTGSVVYRASDPGTSHLEITIPADSLEVLTPSDTAEIRQVTEMMRTKVLRVAEYPEIRFTATGGPATDKGMRLQGELTLVGQTQVVPVDADITVGPDTLRASGTFSVKQTHFGIKPYSGGPGGAVKVADRVTFEFDAIAVRMPTTVSDRSAQSR